MQSRTFRLFVSSTFSDFTEERKLLQTIVFPKIKEYCKDKKLQFQPIDLRWGVTDEASNDQKTLELCLDEVQTSKLYPYPNFLIMLGDRYGTVILPYVIEKNEFKIILEYLEKHKRIKSLLTTWYKLDVNQLPVDKNNLPGSYIIQERKRAKESHNGIDYTDRKKWKPINSRLLKILQAAVKKTNIEESEKKKYYTSATEAEIIEGIFKYFNKTPFQKKLLEEDDTLVSKDYEHVYAYIRNIKSLKSKENLNSIHPKELEKKFIDEELKDINFVKEEIEKSLNKETNIYETNVDLTNAEIDENGKLAYYYEELNNSKGNFVSKMLTYLKKSVDTFITKIEEDTKGKSDEEIKIQNEAFEQERFKEDKIKLFLGREKPLEKIKKYIDNRHYDQPFVIHGRSGLGKSALMAKSIDNTIKAKTQDKVIYRFVGSTTTLNDSPSLLISILRELGIKEEIKKIINLQTGQEEDEKIEEFYLRIHEHFINTKEEKIIFIDAIDQLTNEDEFLWLPKELHSNLKIVISALNDETYDDSKYFETLKNKTDNLYTLERFKHRRVFIHSKLKQYDRTITPSQRKKILSGEDSISPLYLTVAVEEIRHWNHETKKELATSQKEIISKYISNLHTKFHHDKELIKRVFSYLYLADGLSESELLEILNADDKGFIQKIAPDTHHIKETSGLPIVIWARLHFQIKEFLKIEDQDGEETMKFFHREFKKSFFPNIDIIYRDLISLIQRLIKDKNEPFDNNRWGKIYVHIFQYYIINYDREQIVDKKSDTEYEKFILEQYSWGAKFTRYLFEYFYVELNNNQTKKAMILGNLLNYTLDIVYSNGHSYAKRGETFINLKRMLAHLYREIKKFDKVENLLDEALVLINKFKNYGESLGKERSEYIIKNDIAVNYMAQKEYSKAKLILEEQLSFFENLYKSESKNLEFDLDSDYALTLKNLGQIAYHNKDINLAYEYETKAVEVYKQSNTAGNTSDLIYYSMLIDYGMTCEEIDHEKADLTYVECLKEIKKRYDTNQSTWAIEYYRILVQFGKFKKDFSLISNSFFIIKELVEENPDRWINSFINRLGDLVRHYIKDSENEKVNYIIEEIDNTVKFVLKLFSDKSNYYFNNDIYIYCMDLISDYYKKLDLQDKQILTLQVAIPVIKDSSNNIGKVQEMYYISYISILRNIQKLDQIACNRLDINMFKDVIEYRKNCLIFLRKAFQNDYQKWADEYTIELINIATNYYNAGQVTDGFIYKEETFDICLFLVKKSYDDYADKYFKTLDNNRLNFKRYGLTNNLIDCNKKHLHLLMELCQKNVNFKNMFIKAYQELCESYYMKGLNENNLNVLEEYYIKFNTLFGNDIALDEIKEKFFKPKSEVPVTLKELILLANYLAYEKKSVNIQIDHLLRALSFINLNKKAINVFEQIIYIDQLQKRRDGLKVIQMVKKLPLQELDQESMNLINQLVNIFDEEPIGNLT